VNGIRFTPVAAFRHSHQWRWQGNSSDLAFGTYRCACGATRCGAVNFNAPGLRGTDLTHVPQFKEKTCV